MSDEAQGGLSAEELAFFKENGYSGPHKVYEPDEARKIASAVSRKARTEAGKSPVYGDNHFLNYDRHLDIPELARHIFKPEIVKRVQSVLGPNVLAWRGEFFVKYPGSSGTEWHQVEEFRYSTGQPHLVPTKRDPNFEYQITTWTALTPATKENGCFKVMPGTHKTWYFDESKHVNTGRGDQIYDASQSDTSFFGYDYAEFKIDSEWEADESKAHYFVMDPGEFVMFTGKLMHGSLPNITKDDVRMAFVARYVATHVQVYPGLDQFVEHGSSFDLSNYGTVLVAGEDEFGHNRRRMEDLNGTPYPDPHPGW